MQKVDAAIRAELAELKPAIEACESQGAMGADCKLQFMYMSRRCDELTGHRVLSLDEYGGGSKGMAWSLARSPR